MTTEPLVEFSKGTTPYVQVPVSTDVKMSNGLVEVGGDWEGRGVPSIVVWGWKTCVAGSKHSIAAWWWV